jgi:predicted dehydrogenase
MRALARGKHVLTEARMAMNTKEAREMLEASLQHPNVVAQIVPFAGTFKVDQAVTRIISQGRIGTLLSIDMRITDKRFIEPLGPLTWRQDRALSGYNALTMGMYYESLMRWVGPASKVMAMTEVFVPQRRDPQGLLQSVSVPDHIDTIAKLVCGAQAHLQFSAVTGMARGSEVWIYGTSGTLVIDLVANLIWLGSPTSESYDSIEIPLEEQGSWRVEEEFVEAIRGEIPVTKTSFADGVRYMEFTEAVARSSQTEEAISLPL